MNVLAAYPEAPEPDAIGPEAPVPVPRTAVVSELAMFPLGTVLLPSMILPLHVFEPRYRVLARRCVDGDRQLGVVLIERGSEVGGGDVRCLVGTRARVLEAVELEDGRWILGLVGTERIQVAPVASRRPLPAGRGQHLRRSAGRTVRRRGAGHQIERLLRRVLALKAELGEPAAPATVVLDADPAIAAWQAAALAPLGPFDAQRVLESPAADDRLALVASLLEDEAAVLAQRVAGG